jgi:hypothetical protein
VAAVLVLALLAGVLLLWQRPWESSDGDVASAELPSDVSSRLTGQLRSLAAADSQKAFVAAAGDLPDATRFGRRTWSSLIALGATNLDLRYVSGGEVADRADGSAEAVVDVAWRAGQESGLGATALHRSTVALRIAPEADGGLSIVDAASRKGPLPLWLAGRVEVERGRGTVVVSVDGGDGSFPLVSMGEVARDAVTQVVPKAAGEITVVMPHTQEQAAMLLGQESDTVAPIAAVATRLDDSASARARDVVVLNPRVFTTMDQRAAQVVLTHEATHLLTGAVGTRAATWVVEGFADFVALHDDTEPLSVSAGQVLTQVRDGRVPKQLPDAEQFSSAGRGLGAVYESTWMIFRMLGERYPDSSIVELYRAVLAGRPVARALDASMGLSEKQLTAQWRRYLTKSASTVS